MTRTRVRLPLALVVAILAFGGTASAGGGGCHSQATTDESGKLGIELSENCFLPTILRVPVGSTVAWKNADQVVHTITAAAGVFDDEIGPGVEFRYTFGQEGVFPYYCLLHPRMAGAVVVGDGSLVEGAAPPAQPVASLSDTRDEGTSPMRASLIATFIAVPLSFAAGRILRGRRQTT